MVFFTAFRVPLWVIAASGVGLAHCTPSSKAAPPKTHASASRVAPEPDAQPLAGALPGHVAREEVLAVLSQGPPALLERLDVEPVTRPQGGGFYGWRLIDFQQTQGGQAALRKGDIVLLVNGNEIQTPFQCFDIFQSLAFAPELRFTIERNHVRQEIRYVIDDNSPSPGLSASAAPHSH